MKGFHCKSKYKYLFIIPARGGSKRFPGKNIHPLNGKPLIAHSIEWVKEFDNSLNVYVSTDSEIIANVAKNYQARVLQRPPELAGDFVTTAATLQYVANELVNSKVDFDYVILLQPTNPLRPYGLLKDAFKIMDSGKYDSLMTVSPSHMKLGRIVDNCFTPWNYRYGQRSQDLEPLYYENGLLYISKKEIVLNGLIIGDQMYPMVVDHLYGTIDIDTIEDLRYAEYIMQQGYE